MVCLLRRPHALDERYLARVLLADVPPVPQRAAVPPPCPRTGSGGARRASSSAVRPFKCLIEATQTS